jgi:hypothetical protein
LNLFAPDHDFHAIPFPELDTAFCRRADYLLVYS